MGRRKISKAKKRQVRGLDSLGPNGPKSICILTRELYGALSLTDAGAAVLGLAQQLSETGETVTLVWIPPIEVANSIDAAARLKLVGKMSENYLIDLQIVTDCAFLSPHLHSPEKASLAAYYFLKSKSFDEVYCALEGGLAYYTLLAKEMDLLDATWPFTLLVHTPAEWSVEADKSFLGNLQEIAVHHMERYCLESASLAVFNSQYIRDWMAQRGWQSAAKPKVLLPLLPHELRLTDRKTAPVSRSGETREIGMWPGWEFQRGLVLLCDALDKLALSGKTDLTINFFGPFSRLLGEHTGGLIMRRARQWPFAVRFFPRLTEEESLDYLRQRKGSAVLPDLMSSGSRILQACIEAGIPLIATSAGSAPEFVDAAGKREFHEPSAAQIADGIGQAMSRSAKLVQPSQSRRKIEESWELYRKALRHDKKTKSVISRKTQAGKPKLVTIVIAHYERPKFLADAVKSVEQQDYPNIEVILVDDGSKKPESLAFLKSLEPRFRKRGWKIIRQKNKYLGAARNAGIRAGRGAYVLFLDDDNALLSHAVTTFVRAIEASGADICTSVSKIFLGPHLPKNPDDGKIEYFPLGGSLDCAFIHNSFGDANAIIRREVFSKIGYLLEDYGFVASDWEFFTRAALHDLKIRIIPEATYWYRSSAEGMFRTGHWHETRLPILKLFQKHGFKGLGPIYQLLIAQNTDDSERKGYHFRLRYNLANLRNEKLNLLGPDSDEALQHLAGTAAAEGRSDTALNLLGQVKSSNFAELSQRSWSVAPVDEMSMAEEPLAPAQEQAFDLEKLKRFSVASSDVSADPPLSFVEHPNYFTVQSSPHAMIVATLAAAVPAGGMSLSFNVTLPEEISAPLEVIAGLVQPDPSEEAPTLGGPGKPGKSILASSGWLALGPSFESRTISLVLNNPAKAPLTLAICIRHAKAKMASRNTLVRFSDMMCTGFLGLGQPRRPRLGAPPERQYARALTSDQMGNAQLATAYDGKLDLLEFPPDEKGFLLKPSRSGVVVAVLPWAFPAFAKGIVGSVEIAHEKASPFEFALALARPSELGAWTYEGPLSSVGFSGWRRVERKFEIHEVSVELEESMRYGLSICAAIRLPPGSSPEPANSFWRKIALTW